MSEWLEKQLKRLNEYQREAVLTEEKAAVVNAHVGSGKTTVLIARMVWLHEVKGIPYHKMVVLTFTNKAADEIRDRLREAEKTVQESELEYLGTFHSVAMRMLKTMLGDALEASFPGWNREFSVITPEEELEVTQDLIAEHGLKIKYKNRLKKRLEQKSGRKVEDDLPVLLNFLQKTKRERNLLTFDDLIQTASELLDAGGTSGWSPEAVLVDEAQDCDEKQLLFLERMVGEDTRFFAVGDPNQTIYSWRGSRETTMFSLKKRYQAKEYTLPVNYRSSAEILQAAGRFLQSGDRLVSERSSGGNILVKNHYDPFQEAEYLAEQLKTLHEEGREWKDMAVFYRLQEQSEILSNVFKREGVPCYVAVKKTVSDRPVLEFLLQLFRCALSEQDETALKRLVMNPSYGPGLKGKKAQEFLREKPRGYLPLYDQIRDFQSRFRGTGMLMERELYEYFQLDRYLHPTSASYEEDKAAVMTFLRKMLLSFDMEKADMVEGIRQYLNQAALYQMQLEPEREADEVQLMTLHASKGLEFSCVFLIGVNQGLIPLWGKSEAEEEEERRLFFVGMTRAKDRLELSYYTNPARQRVMAGPGRYLQMMPAELLDWKEQKSMEEKRAHLQNLRKAVMENQMKEKSVPEKQKIRHSRYGVGVVLSEDEMTVTGDFEGYGEKTFLKMMVEYL